MALSQAQKDVLRDMIAAQHSSAAQMAAYGAMGDADIIPLLQTYASQQLAIARQALVSAKAQTLLYASILPDPSAGLTPAVTVKATK
jgi:hypothetical protein